MRKLTTEEFIERAKEVHKDTYLYDKTKYTTAKQQVTITCRKHGDFVQQPYNHLGGKGCRQCGFVVIEPRRKITLEQFIENAQRVHGSTYSYDKFVYINNTTKGIIICQKHGEFLQAANPHIRGNGCPTCKTSRGERRVLVALQKHHYLFIQQKRFKDCADLAPLPFDFAVLEGDEIIALIEFQGLHHYKPINSWGGKKNFETVLRHDNIKKEYCAKNEIPLLTVPYKTLNVEWVVMRFMKMVLSTRSRKRYISKAVLEKLENC